MGLTAKLHTAVQRCIDDHLDLIDEMLRGSGMSRSERQSILDDVQTQVLDMLAERAEGEPTVEEVRAVIAELDPPESYATEGEVGGERPAHTPRPATSSRFSKLAIIGAFWGSLPFVFAILLALVAYLNPGDRSSPAGVVILQVLLLPLGPVALTAPFGTTILGWIAVAQIRYSAGRLHGLGLALANSLVYPILLLLGISYGLAVLLGAFLEAPLEILDLTYSHSWNDLVSNSLIWTLAIAIWLVTSSLLVRWVWRAANRPVGQP